MTIAIHPSARPLPAGPLEVKSQSSYIARIRALVAEIFTQLEKTGQKDKDSLNRLRADFRRLSHLSANDQRKIGTIGFMGALSSAAFAASQMLVPEEQKVLLKFASERCPDIASLFSNRTGANQQIHSAEAQLAHTDLSAKLNKQTDDSTKRQMTELLEKLNNLLASASRPA